MSQDEKSVRTSDREIFGSFFLGGSEFAISVSAVQEVVNSPKSYTSVPLAPPYLKGLFNLRGTVIPVIDLRHLLNLSAETIAETQKIAVVELEGSCVGLLFDKTGEVFRSHEDERSDFEVTEAGSVIGGVFKKDSGQRIIQILMVSRLFQLKNVPKDENRNRLGRENLSRKRGQRQQCISFFVGPSKCALPIGDIREILKVSSLGESALGVGSSIGTIDLRGSTVPVVDFPALLKYRDIDRSKSATQGDRRVIVMRLENELFGLLVDGVDSIISYFPDELIKFPIVEQSKADMFVGCITGHGDVDILLLNHQQILSHDEIIEVTRGHSKLYRSKGEAATGKKEGGARKTYITFNIDGPYAVAINDIREIISFPQQMLRPPGLQSHICGVLNLRGELVTIVDARVMYASKGESRPLGESKVLVFHREGLHFGLVVNEVESILTISEADKVKLPDMLIRSKSMTDDVSEAVEALDANRQKHSLLILNPDSVARRVATSLRKSAS